MTKLFTCLFLLYSVVLCAQGTPFPTPGLEYGNIFVCGNECVTGYENRSLRYVGDVTYCGITWNRFLQLPNLNLNQEVLLRAEAGKYFQYYGCSTDALLYDFSKEPGDTIVTFDLGALVVMSVGPFTLDNGETRKKMTLYRADSPGFIFHWVDGIGDIENGFLRAQGVEGGYDQFVCMRDSLGAFYHGPEWPLNCDSLLCPLPIVKFEYTCTGRTFQFTNLSERSDEYFWDFGDGTTSTEENPVHTFSDPGCYIVILKAKSDCLPHLYRAYQQIPADAPVFWKEAPHQPPTGFLQMQFFGEQNGWAIGNKRIWKTTDGGIHWDSIPYPGPTRHIQDMQFKDFEHGIINIRKTPNSIYGDVLWTDDGSTWTLHVLGNYSNITALERLNDSVAVLGANGDIFVTKNHGQIWQQISVPVTLITDFVSIGGDACYFIGQMQLMGPWEGIYFGKSPDALNWQTNKLPGLDDGSLLYFSDANKGLLSAGDSLFYTENAGVTWSFRAFTPQVVHWMSFADSLHGWVTGHHTGIYGTNDGGQTWIQQDWPRTTENVFPVAAISANHAFAVTLDGLFEFHPTPVDTVSICETSLVISPLSAGNGTFTIYPNPASDHLQITWSEPPGPDMELAVFNAQGLAVLRWPASQTNPISIRHLPPGLYFIQMVSGNNWRSMSYKVFITR